MARRHAGRQSPGVERGAGHRRAVGADDGQRRHRVARGEGARPPPAPHLCGPDPAHARDIRRVRHAPAQGVLARRPASCEGRTRPPSRTAGSCSRIAATADRRCSTSRTLRCSRGTNRDAARSLVDLRIGADGSSGGARRAGPFALAAQVPGRLAERLLAECRYPPSIAGRASFSRDDRMKLAERLTSYQFAMDGHEGFKKAEVTGGGVALD